MNIEQLHNLFLQCHLVCTDTRKVLKNDMYFALKGEHFNGNAFANEAIKKGAKYAIIDEEAFCHIPQTILVPNVLETLQELAAFHRTYLNIPIIAITGSNGKTTTKELINITLSKKYKTVATIGNLNNHIGVPLTLLSMDKATEIGIVEMGANHLKEIEFLCHIAKPDYGYITNFGKAHLEGFGSLEGVIKGKCELYDYLKANKKIIFVNGHDATQIEKTKHSKIFLFGKTNNHFDVSIDFVRANPFVKSSYNHLEIQSQLIGEYNFNNISAAIAIANYFKVEDEQIKTAIESYIPSNNRSQIIKKGTNKIILDAYNANPTSMAAALHNFEKQKGEHKIVILGDMFELGNSTKKEHQHIVNLFASLKLENIILIGENFFKTEVSTESILVFKSFETFKDGFDLALIRNTTFLIKGSRGMALERVLKLL